MENIPVSVELLTLYAYNETMSIQLGQGFRDQYIHVIPTSVLRELCRHPILQALHVTDIGYFPDAQYHYRERPEGCSQHILIYCVQGTGFVRRGNGSAVEVNKDMAFHIAPDVSHVYGSSVEEPWHIYWVHYAGDLASWYAPHSLGSNDILRVPFQRFPMILELFQTMFRTLDQGLTLGRCIHCSQVLGHLLSLVYMSSSDFSAAELECGENIHSTLYHVEAAITFFQSRMSGSCTLAEAADSVGLSKSQLTVVFKRITGYSPMAFFIGLKMQLACRYLDLTDLTIAEIAAAVGYKDPYYFSRAFSKTIGMAPRTYRNMDKG